MILPALAVFLAFADPDARVRAGRGEVFVDAADDMGPRGTKRVHGAARLGLGFGFVLEDPIAALAPGIVLDLREIVPLTLELGVAFRLRMFDRQPDQRGVLRRSDWDEVGDYFAFVRQLKYRQSFAFGWTGVVDLEVDAGTLWGSNLGHGTLVRDFHNGLDVDRRRLGVDARARVSGRMLEQPAGFGAQVLVTDVAGTQILATRVAVDWAGAGLGLSAVGDPTAPFELAVDAGDPTQFAMGRGGRLQTVGDRGAAALGVDLSYLASDGWQYRIVPYVDANWMPRVGQGLHVGIDGELTVGRRRRLALGATAEVTVGSSGYDPAYFDIFYLSQRWHVPFVGTPEQLPADFGGTAVPKPRFVRDANLFGAGGRGALRMQHRAGAFAQIGYAVRPGPLGQTATLEAGLELRPVSLSVVLAHRGRHGFEPTPAGTVGYGQLRVPVLRYLDVEASGGWVFAIRSPRSAGSASGTTGVMTGGGVLIAGVAGRVPW